MFILARAAVYSTLFIGLVLVYLPATVLARAGIVRPDGIGLWEIGGFLLGAAGTALALACIVAFVFAGRGTPAPFDPPRRLVVKGPYRFVRNPMYIGAGLALAGAAIFYRSFFLLGYAAAFLLAVHLFIVVYEEPALRQRFETDYLAYCRRTGRWWPNR
jgi:protein-S-isoprenylcysteine O-methyltransferase Ste14